MAYKPPLLYLVHRIPYPPNKGDKIRSFHTLKYLAESFSVYLGSFVDNPEDWQWCPVVREYCDDAAFFPVKSVTGKAISAGGFLFQTPLTDAFYQSSEMQAWVDKVVEKNSIRRALVFCSPMAQFVSAGTYAGSLLERVIVDFVDVDSKKWAQYSTDTPGLKGAIFAREAKLLGRRESSIAKQSNLSIFVSEAEAELFRQSNPAVTEKVVGVPNGVDTDYFNPQEDYTNPYEDGVRALVFTGQMDYPPNIQAVEWFVEQVFGRARDKHRGLEFWIVGNKPSSAVRSLARQPGVTVTGRVDDIRPYLFHAEASVAPMSIARGIQNKVLEAMALGCCVVASDAALTGIGEQPIPGIYPANQPGDYLGVIDHILARKSHPVSERMRTRTYVTENFDWESNIAKISSAIMV